MTSLSEGSTNIVGRAFGPGAFARAGRQGWFERLAGNRVAVPLAPVENRPQWTLPRRQAEIERPTGLSISTSRLGILLREKGGSAGAVPVTR